MRWLGVVVCLWACTSTNPGPRSSSTANPPAKPVSPTASAHPTAFDAAIDDFIAMVAQHAAADCQVRRELGDIVFVQNPPPPPAPPMHIMVTSAIRVGPHLTPENFQQRRQTAAAAWDACRKREGSAAPHKPVRNPPMDSELSAVSCDIAVDADTDHDGYPFRYHYLDRFSADDREATWTHFSPPPACASAVAELRRLLTHY